MKKLVPYLLAAALAAPVFGAGLSRVNAQPPSGGDAAQCDHGGGGPRGGHHGRGRHANRDLAGHAEHRARMLTAILDLDAHQASEVRRILNRAATEAEALMQEPRSDATRTSMHAIHERAKNEIDALLTPAQRATMDRMEAVRGERHGRGEGDGRGHHANPRGPEARPRR